jgi:hypothetical protein
MFEEVVEMLGFAVFSAKVYVTDENGSIIFFHIFLNNGWLRAPATLNLVSGYYYLSINVLQ